MKTKTLAIHTGFYDPNLEAIINKKDMELKEMMRKKARHLSKSNRPLPIGDNMLAYIGEPKAGYEHLIAYIFQHLQPDSHAPNTKIDEVRFGTKAQSLDTEIGEKKAVTDNMENQIDNYHPGSVPIVLWIVGSLTIINMITEIVFNTSALQDWGDTMLMALLLSIGISSTVFAFSHISAHIYKRQPTRVRKILTIFGALVIVFAPFLTLAILRTRHLAGQDIASSPSDFVTMNMFLFIVSFLLSVFGLPEWSEIKQHLEKRRIYRAIAKQKTEVKNLKKEKGEVVDTFTERTQDRITLGHYANHSIERVKKLYIEAVETFKATCLDFRTDSKTPDCFYTRIPELDVADFHFSFNFNNKES